MRYLFLLLLLSATFWACQPEEACISTATNRVVLGFFVDTTTGRLAAPLDIRLAYSTTADSAFLDERVPAEENLLPSLTLRLDPQRDTTVFYMEGFFNDEPFSDSLVLRYQRRYRLISPDCPLEVSFQQLQLVSTSFDSVQILNTELREPSDDIDVQIIRPQLP